VVLRSVPAPGQESVAARIASVSTLDDPVRAAIFFHLARSGEYITRDQAAGALGITRRVAAFHLDKLVDAGLVDVTFKRVTGRTGPGAGRSSKLYRRSERRLDVSIPTRNYELLARLLSSAAYGSHGPSPAQRLEPHARAFGFSDAAAARERAGGPTSRSRLLRLLLDELTRLGFEPLAEGDGVLRLRNCPYHEVAREDPDFVCALNLALMSGVVEGLELMHISPALEPRPGMCCVAFHTKTGT
jgi:predicted ArsR family transcriptional regulator